MSRSLAPVIVLAALVLAACSGGGEASTATPAPTEVTLATPVGGGGVALIQGLPPEDFYQASCASCHGVDREGIVGPSLTEAALTAAPEMYVEAIKNGRPGTAMPAWSAVGLTDPEIETLVAYLRGETIAVGGVPGNPSAASLGLEAPAAIELPPIERTAAQPVSWTVTNPTDSPLDLVKLTSSTLSVFLLDPLPIRLEPGASRELSLVFVPNPRANEGDPASGTAALWVRNSLGVQEQVHLGIRSEVGEHAPSVRLSSMRLPDYPSRVAIWSNYVYVGYLGGLIEVYEWDDVGSLTLVESVTSIAATPNHGPDGTPNPEAAGRLIGGFAFNEDGTLYVSHSDPRLNEGEFLKTGHLADLNSGMLTALEGPAGEYGLPEHRRDLVVGLPRNVTNHMPLGLAFRDGWLYVAVGAMTDSGLPDESKPEPDTELSGAVLRLNVGATDRFPLVVGIPGGAFATSEVLEPGLLEVFATGMRNAFGLAFGPDGELYLSDQSSDGGATPQPAGDDGPAGLAQNLGPDHLHRVRQGDYLGQPNLARGEPILNDGSEYADPVANPDYSPPVHVFGVHNSATGIAWYEGDRFPDLDGRLLVSKFSGAAGLQALAIDDGRVTDVAVVATRPQLSNVTDVAVGPNGEIVIAEFWEKRLRIGRTGAPPSPAAHSDHFYFGINVDADDDSPDAFEARTGIAPDVLVRFYRFPLTDSGQENLARFLETSAARRTVALVTLEPHEGLDTVTDEAIAELTSVLEATPDASVMLRFGHEMNGSWYPWSQQPEAYVETFRRLARAVRDAVPSVQMLWAPNYGGGYPFSGGRYETTSGESGFALLDTNSGGVVDERDDPYAPYYPGDDVVDWVGMSLYHWGSAYPWGENELAEDGKFLDQLRGDYVGANGDDRALPDFYAEYAERRGKPLAIPETAALYDPAQAGDELALKSAWWGQVFSSEVAAELPLLRMVNWFEHRKPESEVGGTIIDWRATGTDELASAFSSHLETWLAARAAR